MLRVLFQLTHSGELGLAEELLGPVHRLRVSDAPEEKVQHHLELVGGDGEPDRRRARKLD